MLESEITEQNDIVHIVLKGNLDALTAQEFRPTIEELVSKQKTKIIVNMASLKVIDSSGVGAIVSLFKRIRMLGGDVKIACLVNQPKEIFRILRLDKAFDIFESVDVAVAKFQKS